MSEPTNAATPSEAAPLSPPAAPIQGNTTPPRSTAGDGNDLPDAVLFVPGMIGDWTDQSLGGIATHLVAAFSRLFPSHRFRMDADSNHRVAHIFARAGGDGTDGAAERPIVDLYDLDYHKALVDSFESRSLFMRCVLLFVATVGSMPRFIGALFRRRASGKTLGEKLQILFCTLLLSLSWVYLILLCSALYQEIRPTTQSIWDAAGRGTEFAAAADWVRETWLGRGWAGLAGSWVGQAADWVGGRVQQLVVLITFAALLVRPRWKDLFLSLMTNYYCAYHYLNFGDGRRLVGRLDERLRTVTNDRRYRAVHLFGYSFGSILTIDALFPKGAEPLPGFGRANTLVTIGSPVDMIRTFWPRYLTGRVAGGSAQRWLNVFSPADILSSNLGNDSDPNRDPDEQVMDSLFRPAPGDPQPAGGTPADRPRPVNLPMSSEADARDFSWLEMLALFGLAAHSSYWNPDDPSAGSCFDLILRELYGSDLRLVPAAVSPPAQAGRP